MRLALAEDFGAAGDVTSNAIVPPTATAAARLVARKAGVLAGLEVARLVFEQVNPDIVFESHLSDGARLAPDQVVAVLSGPARGLLAGERTALNFIQRLCGIATQTAQYVEALRGTGVRAVDTRKTTPGYRRLEKAAVRAGGGGNHRIGLYDRILIKDNHEAVAGSVAEAIRRARLAWPTGIEIEVRCARWRSSRRPWQSAPTACCSTTWRPTLGRNAPRASPGSRPGRAWRCPAASRWRRSGSMPCPAWTRSPWAR